MNDTKYNGWTNYATWRINVELFDGFGTDYTADTFAGVYELSEHLKEQAEELIALQCVETQTGQTNLAESYARAFLSEVNYYEIADLVLVFGLKINFPKGVSGVIR